MPHPSFCSGDVNFPYQMHRIMADDLDCEQSVAQRGTRDFHAILDREDALKLSRSDAPKQIIRLLALSLLAANDQLIRLDADIQFVFGKSGHRKRDAQALGALLWRQALDIIGRITVTPARSPEGIAVARIEGNDEGFRRHSVACHFHLICGPLRAIRHPRIWEIATRRASTLLLDKSEAAFQASPFRL